MNVVYCTTVMDEGNTGSAQFARAFIEFCEQNSEIDLTVVSEKITDRSDKRIPVRLNKRAFDVILGYDSKSKCYAKTLESADLSSTNVIFFNNSWLAAEWMKGNNNIPIVTTVRDDNAMSWRSAKIGAQAGLYRRYNLEKFAVKHSDSILCNSGYLSESIAKTYDVHNIVVAEPAYMDYESLGKGEHEEKEEATVRVLFIKNDVVRGGLLLLIRAMELLTGFQFILTIVGPSQKSVAKYIREHAKRQHISFNVIGPVSEREKMREIFDGHDVFCTPSVREAFGVANIEALAMGLKPVITMTGGMPVELGEFGFAARERTAHALSVALKEAISIDRNHWQDRLRKARMWINNNYSSEKMMQRVMSCLYSAATKDQIQGH